MNAYAKIAIKIVIVLVVCLILITVYNFLGKRTFNAAARRLRNEENNQLEVKAKLDSLLAYQDLLPMIRQVQLQDIQTIRNLVPDADEFVLTSYLRTIHDMLRVNHLETNGISIGGAPAAMGGINFDNAFSSDVSKLQEDLASITEALDWFQANLAQMNNMFMSFNFYQMIGTGDENFEVIVGGIEQHTFNLTVRGSYRDIKKFTYDVFNMRPHTALVNFQMSPQGQGVGQSRQYSASFTLVTYGDANTPPDLWAVHNGPTTMVQAEAPEEGGEEAENGGEEPDAEEAA